MSILGTIYSGLSGLLGFSKGLNVISDNVSNMNTPGFKSNQIQFEDMFPQQHFFSSYDTGINSAQIGQGVKVTNTSMLLTQGQIHQTGNQTDAAINGDGYFILLAKNENLYTRSGQFSYNADGLLVSKNSNIPIAGLNAAGQLSSINVDKYRVFPPQATSEITFKNNLSTGGTTQNVNNVQIYDSTGNAQTLNLVFTNNNSVTPGSWLVQVNDSSGNAIANGEIRYQGDGSPATGYNTFTFTYTPSGSAPLNITLNFGDPGSFSGSTSFSGGTTSTLTTDKINGYAVGSIKDITFQDNGVIQITYTNNQTRDIATLALAHFENEQALSRLGNGTFQNSINQKMDIGRPGSGVFGTITGKSLELSNVDLTQQFSDLVIIQRGYQSSSQVLTVANQMIQDLINNLNGKN